MGHAPAKHRIRHRAASTGSSAVVQRHADFGGEAMADLQYTRSPVGQAQPTAVPPTSRSIQGGQVPDNRTGMPDQLKAGIESLSGMAMDQIKVHYNSSKPGQLGAHAYAKGPDIYVAPGQDRHLPHEAWHVVQQMQERVRPTGQVNGGVAVNDNKGLEHEADVMGARAARDPLHGAGTSPAGHGAAIAQGQAAGQGVVQCKISIGGESITHGSRKVNALFNQVVSPALQNHGYKSRGIKSQLVAFIKEKDETFKDNAAFLNAFFPWLSTRTRRTRGDPTPVLKKFEVSGMSRPAWPDHYNSLLGTQVGDNIRHVVRNATLKRALEIESKRVSGGTLDEQKKHFSDMAGQLGIALAPDAGLDVIIPAIYKAVYLNVDNLFAGDGPTNQIIGFAADGVREIGEEYLAEDEDATVNMDVVLKRVSEHMINKANAVRADPNLKQFIMSELLETVRQALASLVTAANSKTVSAQLAGDLVADIGLNFGFDLIDGRRSEDSDDIGGRQARILGVERALQQYNGTAGQDGSLTKIFRLFLGLDK